MPNDEDGRRMNCCAADESPVLNLFPKPEGARKHGGESDKQQAGDVGPIDAPSTR